MSTRWMSAKAMAGALLVAGLMGLAAVGCSNGPAPVDGGTCVASGNPCTTSSECCTSLLCNSTRHTCGCAMTGEVCATDAQCCGGMHCLPNPTDGINECMAP